MDSLIKRLQEAESGSREFKDCPGCGVRFHRRDDEEQWAWKKHHCCTRLCGLSHSAAKRRVSPMTAFSAHAALHETDDCINWTGTINAHGYGSFGANRKYYRSHRFSYELHHGEIPSGYVVMHSCDNRACVNPRHLSIGTNADNTADRDAKKRQARGAKCGRSKLSEEDVLVIRSRGLSYREIAERYSIGKTSIQGIRSGRSWKHLPIDPQACLALLTALQSQEPTP